MSARESSARRTKKTLRRIGWREWAALLELGVERIEFKALAGSLAAVLLL